MLESHLYRQWRDFTSLGPRFMVAEAANMWRRSWIISLVLFAGCGSSKLETGYEPKRLDMPLSEREALYADPYSAQALQAQQENKDSGSGSMIDRPGRP